MNSEFQFCLACFARRQVDNLGTEAGLLLRFRLLCLPFCLFVGGLLCLFCLACLLAPETLEGNIDTSWDATSSSQLL